MARLCIGFAILFVWGCTCQDMTPNSTSYVHVKLYKARSAPPERAIELMLGDVRGLLLPLPPVKGFWVGRPVPRSVGAAYTVDGDYDVGMLFLFTSQRGLAELEEHPSYAEFVRRHGDSFDVRVIDFSPYQAPPTP